MTDREYLIEISNALKKAEINGSHADDPEGSGWIKVSVTLAKQISDRLSSLIAEQPFMTNNKSSFTVRCNSCCTLIEISTENVHEFVNEYGWNEHDFKVTDDTPIGAFVTYDTGNETVMCKCGNKVTT